MNKEIKVIDEEKQIVRVTTIDERWYSRPEVNKETGLHEFAYYPSSTWIAGYYPKGIAFYKWLAGKGWDEAEAIKSAAGNRGSKVHQATEYLEETRALPIDMAFTNNETGQLEVLSTEEINCIQSFATWINAQEPELLAKEMTVFGDGYAGTLDRIYRIKGVIWIVDLKTSQYIWEEMKLQISSYSHAKIDYAKLGITDEEWKSRKLAVLQLGYRLNKVNVKFTEIEDKFDLFKVAMMIWANENHDAKPKQRDYPLIIKLKEAKDGRVSESSKEAE